MLLKLMWFPFKSLKITPALAKFKNTSDKVLLKKLTSEEKIVLTGNRVYLKLNGIAMTVPILF